MKKILFILIIFLSALSTSSLQAKRKVIALMQQAVSDDQKSKWQPEERSIIDNTPFIIHDQNTFYIYSESLLEESQLTIRDEYNNIIYFTIDTILPNEEKVFTLDIEKGIYTIELEFKENIYYGYFEIIK